jgi:hypothetical protein
MRFEERLTGGSPRKQLERQLVFLAICADNHAGVAIQLRNGIEQQRSPHGVPQRRG